MSFDTARSNSRLLVASSCRRALANHKFNSAGLTARPSTEIPMTLTPLGFSATSRRRVLVGATGLVAVGGLGFPSLAFTSANTFAAVQKYTAGSPVFDVKLPNGYRDWRVISVAHEAGGLNDIRIVLGNDIAIKAYRTGTRPFPDGTMIARLAYRYVPSAQNNAVFGQEQSFVAGDPTNVQISVKHAKRFAGTGGWGYGQFESGVPNPSAALMQTCFACHTRLVRATDLVFTRYAP